MGLMKIYLNMEQMDSLVLSETKYHILSQLHAQRSSN